MRLRQLAVPEQRMTWEEYKDKRKAEAEAEAGDFVAMKRYRAELVRSLAHTYIYICVCLWNQSKKLRFFLMDSTGCGSRKTSQRNQKKYATKHICDNYPTQSLNFPVWASNYSINDIKYWWRKAGKRESGKKEKKHRKKKSKKEKVIRRRWKRGFASFFFKKK